MTHCPPGQPGYFPDLEHCRAKPTSFGYVECLVERPSLCPYSLSFGESYFCLHPERESIVARTEQTKPKQS